MTAALFVKKGATKLQVRLQRDCFEPYEIIPVKFLVDNTKCELGIKQYRVKLWREIRAMSPNSSSFVDKSELLKRNFEEVIPANDKSERQVDLGL